MSVSQQILKVAIWDIQPADFLMFGFTSGAVPSSVVAEPHDPLTCFHLFQTGDVDVALVPALSVLRDHEDTAVVPDVGLISQHYPYARIFVRSELTDIKRVAFDPRYAQEVLMTRSILKEHYGASPEYVPVERFEPKELIESHDAVLAVGAEVPTMSFDARTLDLGQEWFELTAYPMVWGVFVGRPAVVNVAIARLLRDAVRAAEDRYDVWVQSQESPAEIRRFFDESFRSRLDLYALEGLDQFAQHMFFNGALTEVPTLPFVEIPDEEEEDESNTD